MRPAARRPGGSVEANRFPDPLLAWPRVTRIGDGLDPTSDTRIQQDVAAISGLQRPRLAFAAHADEGDGAVFQDEPAHIETGQSGALVELPETESIVPSEVEFGRCPDLNVLQSVGKRIVQIANGQPVPGIYLDCCTQGKTRHSGNDKRKRKQDKRLGRFPDQCWAAKAIEQVAQIQRTVVRFGKTLCVKVPPQARVAASQVIMHQGQPLVGQATNASRSQARLE